MLACLGVVAGTGGAARAQAAPQELRHGVIEVRFPYTPPGEGRLWMDAFLPADRSRPVPAVLLVHGGGWSGGSPLGFAGPAEALAKAGLAAFDVGYRLDGPGHPGFPRQVRELSAAGAWIEGHAAVLGLQPGRLGALGSSAGGNLVALLALRAHAPPLSAVVTWSAPLDLASFGPLVQSSCRHGGCGRSWLANDLVDYVGCLPARCPARWAGASPADSVRPGASPAGGVRPGSPAWMIFNSDHEVVPVRGAELMTSRLRSRGYPVVLTVYPGRRHAGEYASEAMGPTVAFLRSQLLGGPRA
jgi:acetyl esterase